MNQIRFLSISSVRSGSTWLQTMLGELPDVEVDYEFKRADRKSHEFHVEVSGPDFRCDQKLADISPTSPIVGSRLTLDVEGSPLPREVYWYLSSTIDKNIRVIHLTRNYADVLFSYFRGPITVLANSARTDTSALYQHLIRQTQSNSAGVFASSGRQPWIDLLVFQNPIGRLFRKLSPKPLRDYLDSKQRYGITPESGESMVRSLFEHDLWAISLAQTQTHYLRIDYDEIDDRFEEIARFVGSRANAEILQRVLQSPPTKKLAALSPTSSVRDAEGLLAICDRYQQKKAELFASHSSTVTARQLPAADDLSN